MFDSTFIHHMTLLSLIVDISILGRIQNASSMFRIVTEPRRLIRSVAGCTAIGATTEMQIERRAVV
jgi:hypothetical protein